MSKDICTREFYSDPARYADVINGVLCGGAQVVKPENLQLVEGHTGRKSRDHLFRLISIFRRTGEIEGIVAERPGIPEDG